MNRKIRKHRSQSTMRRPGFALRSPHRFSHIAAYRNIAQPKKKFTFVRHTYDNDVKPKFHMTLKKFMSRYYLKLNKSDIDIINIIKAKTNITFTRATLSKWHKETGILARNPSVRFQLAMQKGKYSHAKVANKINYKNRYIDYTSTNKKRLQKLIGRCYLESEHSFKLANLLHEQGKSKQDLANSLGVSIYCIKAWCSGHNKIHPEYWKPIEKYLGLRHNKIFESDSIGESLQMLIAKELDIIYGTVYNWVTEKGLPQEPLLSKLKQLVSSANFRNKLNKRQHKQLLEFEKFIF